MEAIIGGTARVLASRGYAGTTTNHIAEAAGVSIGSYYQYFADKDAAVAALVEQYARDTLDFAWEHAHDQGRGRTPVGAWLFAMLDRASENQPLVRVLFQEVPYTWSLPAVREAMAGALGVVERLGGDAIAVDGRQAERTYVILRTAVAVITDVAADAELWPRREAIVEELGRMFDSYLAALSC